MGVQKQAAYLIKKLEEYAISQVDEVTREFWILGAFPEWGTWLNGEIDQEVVGKGIFAMWRVGCTGLWIKTGNNTNIFIDLWSSNGKRTRKSKEMAKFHQMCNVTGGRIAQPNLRTAPVVYDPFAVAQADAVLSIHYHSDHIGSFYIAIVLKNCDTTVSFIGSQKSVEEWLSCGVPRERCQVVKPGDMVKIRDAQTTIVDSLDRACFVTNDEDVRGRCPTGVDEEAVNYIIETSAGSVYHNGDSYYSTCYAKHSKDYDIDVALSSYGENSAGSQDKMIGMDVPRTAKALNYKVVIPLHYDVWTNFKVGPQETNILYEYKKGVLDYKFHPFTWDVGEKYV